MSEELKSVGAQNLNSKPGDVWDNILGWCTTSEKAQFRGEQEHPHTALAKELLYQLESIVSDYGYCMVITDADELITKAKRELEEGG